MLFTALVWCISACSVPDTGTGAVDSDFDVRDDRLAEVGLDAADLEVDAADEAVGQDEGSEWDIQDVEATEDLQESDRIDEEPIEIGTSAIEWVPIFGGTFLMGDDKDQWDMNEPVHLVTVPTFELARTEVTVSQYRACVDADVCSEPRTGEACNWGVRDRENHPVNCIDWFQAREFSQWSGGRLPTEAEWEYAAKSGGQDIDYPWGNEPLTCQHAVVSRDDSNAECGVTGTDAVCSRTQGNSEQGLCDLAGNVWEWLEDAWHVDYQGAPTDGSAWMAGPAVSMRAIRSGCWATAAPDYARIEFRAGAEESYYFDFVGFRPARSVP
ncbi:MAG: formylglycine-generating enzyme family protein [Bradymonadales bacterium]|nr:formylglycine-generating enzyme family protein [Bradymonadales bacterium]